MCIFSVITGRKKYIQLNLSQSLEIEIAVAELKKYVLSEVFMMVTKQNAVLRCYAMWLL
jgi:hypothetical protein